MIRFQRWKGAAFTVPFQLGFAFLYLLPIGYAVYQSLFLEQQSGLGLGGATREFTGLDNYQLGLSDSAFMGSILRVVLFACVQIPFMLLVSLVLALFLDALTAKAANRWGGVRLTPSRKLHSASHGAFSFVFLSQGSWYCSWGGGRSSQSCMPQR